MTDKASTVTPPRVKNSKRNLQLIAVTAASVAKQLSDCVRDRYVTIRFEAASTEAVDFCFGVDNTVAVNYALTGDQSGEANALLGYRLAGGDKQDFELSGADNWIAVMGSTTGNLRIVATGPRRTSGQTDEGP
jgi:hypothetical protein